MQRKRWDNTAAYLVRIGKVRNAKCEHVFPECPLYATGQPEETDIENPLCVKYLQNTMQVLWDEESQTKDSYPHGMQERGPMMEKSGGILIERVDQTKKVWHKLISNCK